MTEEEKRFQRLHDKLIRLAVQKGNLDEVQKDLKDMKKSEDINHYIQNVQMPRM